MQPEFDGELQGYLTTLEGYEALTRELVEHFSQTVEEMLVAMRAFNKALEDYHS